MKTRELDALMDAVRAHDLAGMRSLSRHMDPVDIAEAIDGLPIDQALTAFRMLEKDQALHVFAELSTEAQRRIINAISDGETLELLADLWMDDKVEMVEEMPATLVKKVLRNSSPQARELLNRYLNYPEASTGNIMTAEFMELRRHDTVQSALARVREASLHIETIYTCFVTDETRILQGVVALKDLLLAKDDQLVEGLMDEHPVYVNTTTPKKETVSLFLKYDLIALPVVDNEHRLVGLVTVDDAVDELVDKDTEDFQRMAAIIPTEKPYVKTSALRLALNRFPWLVVSLATNIVVSFVLDSYSPIYVVFPILVSFIPMLMGTGGNAGSQSSTLVIRGMALGEIRLRDFFAVIWKEIRVALLLGVVLAAISFVRLWITYPGQTVIALLVSVSLVCAILVGKSMGAALPMLARLLRLDPALMASPLVTTVVDILALMVYFGLSGIFLPIG